MICSYKTLQLSRASDPKRSVWSLSLEDLIKIEQVTSTHQKLPSVGLVVYTFFSWILTCLDISGCINDKFKQPLDWWIYEPLFSHFQSFPGHSTLRSSAFCCEMEKQNRNKHTLCKIFLCGHFVYETAHAHLQNQCIKSGFLWKLIHNQVKQNI